MKKQEDQSELEEETEEIEQEDVEDFDSKGFKNFMGNWSMEEVTPSLKQTNIPQTANLESGIEEVQAKPAEDKKEEIIYETAYVNPDDYRNIEEEHRRRNEDFVARESRQVILEEPTLNFTPRTLSRMHINPELQEIRQGNNRLERDYVAQASRLDKDESLPFEKQKKYTARV